MIVIAIIIIILIIVAVVIDKGIDTVYPNWRYRSTLFIIIIICITIVAYTKSFFSACRQRPAGSRFSKSWKNKVIKVRSQTF